MPMWRHVTREFGRLLSNRLYPALFLNPDYQAFLASAGVHPPYPHDVSALSPLQRKMLGENGQLRAKLLELKLTSLKSLEHAGAEAVEFSGPLKLYRLWNSQVKGNEMRFFWFTEELLLESFREAGGKKKDRLEWLRGQLAVAYNWSLCDRIARLDLKAQQTIPGVLAVGLPIRGVQITPQDPVVAMPPDYWQNFGKYSSFLPGGKPQIFMFLLPLHGVAPYW